MAKFIDEKGMLFGKINIIDFLVVVFLAGLMPMLYFGNKIFMRGTNVVEVTPVKFIEIEMNCLFKKINPEVLGMISAGDKEFSSDEGVICEIISMGQSEPYQYEIDLGSGQKIFRGDDLLKQVTAKVRLRVELRSDNNLYYNNFIVKIGSPFQFKTDKYFLDGTFIEEKRIKSEKSQGENMAVELKVKFSNLLPELAEVIKAGDRQIESVNEGIYRIIATVEAVNSDIPSEVIQLMNGPGGWVIGQHPKNKDMVLRIKALCVRRREGIFLNNEVTRIGATFVFTTDLYSITGVVLGMDIDEQHS